MLRNRPARLAPRTLAPAALAAALLCFPALPARAAAPAPGAPAQGSLIKAPGATIYVEVHGAASGSGAAAGTPGASGGAGSAVPFVVVNGGPGFSHDFMLCTDVWDEIAKRRPVVFYDQRGTGKSPALAEGQSCNLADQIADLEAVRAHLGAPQIDLLGSSWGGYLVMAYAASHPEHIRHLVILDSAAPKRSDTKFLFKEVYPDVVERQERFNFAEEMGDAKAGQAGIQEYLGMIFYSPEKRDAFLARFAPGMVLSKKVNQAIGADLERFDLNPELRKFNFPTLVITGRYDMNVAPIVAWEIHRAIPASKFVVFERSGHFPFYEEPERFQTVIEDFFAH
jgi:proline iminopeptidase